MTLEGLRSSGRILFECISGSKAYGTNSATSDVDIKGIFFQPASEIISFGEVAQQINDHKNDISFYSLRRYLELASAANPNILELLFAPEDCILCRSPIYDKLIEYRHEFITRQCLITHQAYALAQIKKAKGRNKWINNPQPEVKPSMESFAYFIDSFQNSAPPGRPVRLNNSSAASLNLKISSVEHCPGLYRAYQVNNENSLFTNSQINCSSISMEEEKCFCGFIYFNEDAWKKALTDHKNYWEWISNRNPERWIKQEIGALDYDAKNMQHTIRLLLTAREILTTATVKVRFYGDELQLLIDIRNGKYTYAELLAMADEINNDIEMKSGKLDMKDNMNANRVSEIFLELMELGQ